MKINSIIYTVLCVIAFVEFILLFQLSNMSKIIFEHRELHSSFEGISAIIYLIMSWFLYHKKKEAQGGKYVVLSIGFLAMGLILIFVSITYPGRGFRIVHYTANFIAAFFLAMIWISKSQQYILKHKWVPWIVGIIVITIGMWELFLRDTLPKMMEGGIYTSAAGVFNYVSGVLFFIAGLYFVVEYYRLKKTEDMLFGMLIFLFSLHCFISHIFQVWTLAWWIWRLIQMVGSVIVLIYVIWDYTQTKASLLISEKKYRDLFEKSADAILIIKNNKFIDCNESTLKMLGYKTKSELLNTHPSELSPEKQPDGKPSFLKADEMMKIALEKGSNRFEWDHKKANGEIFPVEVLLTAMPSNDDSKIIHSVWREISDRKQAEKLESVLFKITAEASISEDLDELYKGIHWHLRDVLDTTNLFFGIINEDETMMSFPYYVDEHDLPPDPVKLPQKLLSEYVIKLRKPLFLKEQDIIDLANKGLIDLDVSGTIPKVWMGAPLMTKERAIGIIVLQSYHDLNLYSKSDLDILSFISEQITVTILRMQIKETIKESERKFRILSSQLENSNSLKELLFDIIAHDLKNPAGLVKGFAEFGLETDPDNEIFQEIQVGTDRLLKVLDNATLLSKIATGDEIDKEQIDITEMIKTITKEFATQLENTKMQLDLNVNKKIIVKANPIISEVFRNYISNAIKYASSGEKIIVDAHEEDGILTINVIDYGDTITEKEQENIFKRSIQLDKTKGSGLGLAIVKRIAAAHKAEVGVRPNKPTGNIFYIKLPVL